MSPLTSPSSPSENVPTFLSVSAFGRQVKASPVTVRRWIQRGMPACRVDRHWRIDVQAALAGLREARA